MNCEFSAAEVESPVYLSSENKILIRVSEQCSLPVVDAMQPASNRSPMAAREYQLEGTNGVKASVRWRSERGRMNADKDG